MTANEQKNRALLELLFHVSRELASALDLRTVLQRILYLALENTGGERGSIVVMDDKGNPIDATIVYGQQFHEHTTQQLRDTVEHGLAGWVVRNRQGVLVNDTSQDQRWLRRPDDAVEQTGAKSALCVPLMVREQLVGVLTLVNSRPNAFDKYQFALMQAIADQAGIAVLNARLYAESQRQARVMTALAEGAMTMNASLQMDDVFSRILNQTMQALQVETAAIGLILGEEMLLYEAAAGSNASRVVGARKSTKDGLIAWVIDNKRTVVIPKTSEDPRFTQTDHLPGIQIKAIASAPIQEQGRVIGILQAINPGSGFFDTDAQLALSGIGSLAGTTIQNTQLVERLQAAHKRYRELFEDSVDSIVITNLSGSLLEANRQAVELSQYSQEMLHTMTIDQLHEVKWNRTGLEFEKLKDNDTIRYESVLHRKDGETSPIEVHVHQVRFEENVSLQWILRDIKERKDLDQLREDLTAMIYHDLRSPLANIVSSLGLLESILPEDRDIRSLLGIANNSTERIQRLVSSLLDINRLESGQKIVTQQTVTPDTLINQAIAAVQHSADNRHQIISNTTSNLPDIWVDPDMIKRVLINLFENAIKYTPAEGNIIISSAVENDWVRLWVEDNGSGIPEAERERIFEKFTRLKGKEGTSGLGVGLAFCRLAIVGHGGKIWVNDAPQRGSQFNITLPIAKREVKK